MAREKDGYRDALERVRANAAGELVTVEEAAKISGLNVRTVTKQFVGWQGKSKGKRIPATALARQIC